VNILSWELAIRILTSVSIVIPNSPARRHTDRFRFVLARIYFEIVEMFTVGRIQPSSGEVPMNEGLQPKPIQHHSLVRWILMCGAMLLVVLLFGAIPVLISYRKIMSA
jgi:hypothetical protein